MLRANDGTLRINQLFSADGTALVADSEEKLCRLVSVFDRVSEIRQLRVNIGKSKVIRWSKHVNAVECTNWAKDFEPLETVDRFK